MTLARGFHTAVLLANDKVLVTGGDVDGSTSARAEVYSPASGTWTATGDMFSPPRCTTWATEASREDTPGRPSFAIPLWGRHAGGRPDPVDMGERVMEPQHFAQEKQRLLLEVVAGCAGAVCLPAGPVPGP
ncbi:kelch repeat-containing protein [Cystobacter ferrugineus]|uniref:kelch repeat-containing protein n=1 Tax=Cystobacter ferrugineus TaxID=83449 RepID=UPI00090399DE|nr:kelch repeat-containing protein [Cystobacter ferrugineus]